MRFSEAAVIAAIASGEPFHISPRPLSAPSLCSKAVRRPNGRSFRSLRRAANSGWELQQPTEKMKLRHAWYRRELAWAALREKLGQ